MPTPTRSSHRRTGRGRLANIGTAIPLAIGLAGYALPSGSSPSATPAAVTDAADAKPAVCAEVIDTGDCHTRYPAGCNDSGQFDATLNYFKNRTEFGLTAPQRLLTKDDFPQLERAIPSGLSTKNHKAFVPQLAALGEGQIVSLVGYLYPSKPEGAESSNCKLEGDETEVDFHLYVGFDADVANDLRAGKEFNGAQKKDLNRKSVIVEMTPHYRAEFQPKWTFKRIGDLTGRQIKAVGQLMIDNEHNIASQNCGRSDAKMASCWRASVWELHPVTEFYVCPTNNCAPDAPSWQTIDQLGGS